MTTDRILPLAGLAATLALVAPPSLAAQGSGVDIYYGRWFNPDPATVFSATFYRPLFGPFDYGLGLTHLDDSSSPVDRTQTGGEVTLGVGRGGSGLYGVAGLALGVRHTDRNVDAHWSAGAGYAWRPVSFLSLAAEARYRVEDVNVSGFWNSGSLDRDGFVIQARLALGRGGARGVGRGPRRSGDRGPHGSDGAFRPPEPEAIYTAARRDGTPEDVARVTASVVQTALDAMGAPYKWGGSDANGYDCSGLIQYAYRQHGILLPRVSRDQARMGELIDRDVAQLKPGDILGFSINGNGVSHVGLYVGDGQFIHSSSAGVKLSSLTGSDGDSRYYRARWAVVRRILN